LNLVTINNREFHIKNSIEETLQYTMDNLYHCHLSHFIIIQVMGENSKTYLQGQLTNDILNLKPNELSKQLLCNIKGQIIAKIYALEIEQKLHLILHRDLWPDVHQLLEKTASLSRVSFLENKQLHVYGLISNQNIPNTFKINENQCLMLSDNPPISIQKPDLFWHFISIEHGEFSIYPSTCRQYLPKPLGLEKEWIHFNKGCYRGQEIIARMHFLGKDKYTIGQSEIDWHASMLPGENHIIDYCPINDTKAIAIILQNL
jgi:folate-binding protein YgfZ